MEPYVFFVESGGDWPGILDTIEADGRMEFDDYVCEGTPEQCDENPDGTYGVAILSEDELVRIESLGVSLTMIPWEGRRLLPWHVDLCSWGNLDAPCDIFPAHAAREQERNDEPQAI